MRFLGRQLRLHAETVRAQGFPVPEVALQAPGATIWLGQIGASGPLRKDEMFAQPREVEVIRGNYTLQNLGKIPVGRRPDSLRI